MLILFAALTLLSSVWLTHVTIASARRLEFGADEGIGVQKFHSHWVPRLGGVPIMLALILGFLLVAWGGFAPAYSLFLFVACLLPAFLVGLAEDITRKAGVGVRLVFTMISAALGWWWLGADLQRLDIPVVDQWLAALPLISFLLTLVAASGIAHAVNIIDGYNGLSGVYALIVLGSLAAVGFQVGDTFVVVLSVVMAASCCGFLVWNYPYGRIFLGDAGAYLVGFSIAEISILLVARNEEVSAWFPMLLAIYPVWETLFSIYRKKILRGMSPGQPDGLHLHMLVYKRLVKPGPTAEPMRTKLLRNSATAPYLWVLALLSAIPALVFWRHPPALMAFCGLFVLSYQLLYWRLVRFQMPQALVMRLNGSKAPSVAEEA